MEAVTWQGRQDTPVEEVPGPVVEDRTGVVIEVTSTGQRPPQRDDAPEAYRRFRDEEDGMLKMVFRP